MRAPVAGLAKATVDVPASRDGAGDRRAGRVRDRAARPRGCDRHRAHSAPRRVGGHGRGETAVADDTRCPLVAIVRDALHDSERDGSATGAFDDDG